MAFEPLEDRCLLSATPGLDLFSLSPALFVQNQGQWADDTVDFVHQGDGVNVAMTDDAVRFQMFRAVESDPTAAAPSPLPGDPLSADSLDDLADTPIEAIQFSASFLGANQVAPVGLDQAETVFNYCVGAQEAWRAEVPSYEIVAYENLYDGIDLQTWGLRSHLKYEFHVAAGADYRQIAVHYDGIAGLSLAADGSLIVELGNDWGQLVDDAPFVYQTIDGQQVEVAGRFVLIDSQTYTFEVTGEYDSSRELVIDPNMVWSTYLGGGEFEEGYGIDLDPSGNVYVMGQTRSSGWVLGGFETNFDSNYSDGFVAKLSPTGDHVWSTYYGTRWMELDGGIAVDDAGNAYVTGSFRPSFNYPYKVFVAKISTEGVRLWSTSMGGNQEDRGEGIALDPSGNVYVTGFTKSSGWTAGGFDTTFNGSHDAFVAKVSSEGDVLWSTYLGGESWDRAQAIAVDTSGNVWVTGDSHSAGWTSGGFNTDISSDLLADAFVAKLSCEGDHLWSTYLGGAGEDIGWDIALDSAGTAYIVGETPSPQWPTGSYSPPPFHCAGFVTHLSAAGEHLWSRYIGGTDIDSAQGVAVDASGGVWVVGQSSFPDWTLAGDPPEGNDNAFVLRLNVDGDHVWSTHFGGDDIEWANDIAIDAWGNLHVTGATTSPGWTVGGFDTTISGWFDAFVAKIQTRTLIDRAGAAASRFDAPADAFDLASSVWVDQGGVVLGASEEGIVAHYDFYLPPDSIPVLEIGSITVSVYGKGGDGTGTPDLFLGAEGARVYAGTLPDEEGWCHFHLDAAAAEALLSPIGGGYSGSMLEVTIEGVSGDRFDLKGIRIAYDCANVELKWLEGYQASVGGAFAMAAFDQSLGAGWDGGNLEQGAIAEAIQQAVSSASSLLEVPADEYSLALEALRVLPSEFQTLAGGLPVGADWQAFWASTPMASSPEIRPSLQSAADALTALSEEWLVAFADAAIENWEAISLNSKIDAATTQLANLMATVGGIRDHIVFVLSDGNPSTIACAKVALKALSPLMRFDPETGADLPDSYLPALGRKLAAQRLDAVPPEITLCPSEVAENQPDNTAVGTFATVGVNPGDTFSYTLVSGTGSSDNAQFTIVGDTLQTAASFNYESKSTYSIRVRSTDQDGLCTEKAFSIAVTNVNEQPAGLALSNVAIPENQPAGSVVGSFTTTDPDAGSMFTYTLVDGDGGDDNAMFVIDGAALTSAAVFDFESRDSYTVRVRSTDQGGLFTEKAFTITVTNANDHPTDVLLSANSVGERQPIGTPVGVFSSLDPDAGDTFTYALVAGEGDTDNAAFSMSADTLRTAAVFDVGEQDTYKIRVRATDQGGLFVEKAFTIRATEVNYPPTFILLSNNLIPENRPAGLVVGALLAADPDGGPVAFSLVDGAGGEGNPFFAIDNGRLVTAATFDFESQDLYHVRVRATDDHGSFIERAFSVGITDSNIALSNNTLPENQLAGTTVGSLTTLEPAGETFAYTLVDGTGSADNARFVIDGDSLLTAAPLDYEAAEVYHVRVRATNQIGAYAEQALAVYASDRNEPPSELLLSNATVPENQSAGTPIGVFTGIDPDLGNALTFSLVAGEGSQDNERVTLAGNTLHTADVFDYETQDTLSIRVRATDQGGLSLEKQFTISVGDVDELVADVFLSCATVAENKPVDTLVGVLSTNVPDGVQTIAFALVDGPGGTDNARFSIDGAELRTAATFDHESESSLSIRVRATDPTGLCVDQVFAVGIANANEQPTDVQLSGTQIPENEPAGTLVGTLTTTDPDAGDAFIYTLVGGPGSADNGRFAIDGNALRTATGLDHESQGAYTVRIRATDQGGLAVESAFSIGVSDVNEQPTAVHLSASTVASGLPVDSLVGLLATADPDLNDTFTYTLVDGPGSDGNAAFAIAGSQLRTAEILNAQLQDTYTIRVRSTDQGGLSLENTFVISVGAEDTTAPTVTAVAVGGTGWAGSLADGYAIPTGSGEQLLPLPWTGIDQLTIAFSEDVLIDQTDLALFGLNVPQNDLAAATFTYDPLTFTATWTLAAPLEADRLTLHLNADGESPVRDAAGNRLDGEWSNPADEYDPAAGTFPSGNGTPGGDFLFRFNVLPGDADRSGTVDAADMAAISAAMATTAGPGSPLDVARDGAVAYSDMYAVHQRLGDALPVESVSPAIAAVDPELTAQSLAATPETPAAGTGVGALELFSLSPALFVENQGQWADDTIDFVHQGAGVNVAMTDDAVRFQMFRAVESDPTAAAPSPLPGDPLSADSLDDLADTPIEAIQFSASFLGANQVAPVGLDQAETVFNYCVGAQEDWRTEVPSYEIVAYENLYDGIDLQTWGLRSHLKYEFHVAAGADYHPIAIHYDGIAGLSLSDDGSLIVDLGNDWGQLIDDAPYIYQQIDGQQVEIAGRFVLIDSQTYTFEVTGEYDTSRALVIDPELAWSTYLGGNDQDWGWSVAADSDGNVLVSGDTESSGWVSGGLDTTFNGGEYGDGFVTKLNPDGTHLWSTYLGGSKTDYARGIAVDSYDNVLVVGNSESSDWISGGFDTTLDGREDAFVAKLSPSGGHLWSTYLGGGSSDFAFAVAVDFRDNLLVTGRTYSSDWVAGGFDTTHGGSYDAFVVKLSSTGGHVWSTCLGGSSGDAGYDVAVDSGGNVLATGFTKSSGWVSGGFDTTRSDTDAFVVKLSPNGEHLWSTYVGGDNPENGNSVAVDSGDNILLTGFTYSSGWVSGGFDATYAGDDAFVAKLSPDGAHLWSTYLGGGDYDIGWGVAVDSGDNVLVTGNTESSGWVSGGFDTNFGGKYDAFVVSLSPGGAHIWSSYLGGSEWDRATSVAIDSGDNLVVAGITESSGWPSGGFDTDYNGGWYDAFVARIIGSIALSSRTVTENEPVGALVGLLAVAQPAPDSTYSFNLVNGVGGTDNALFTVDGNELKTAAVFDYESRSIYSIRVRATDQGPYTDEVLTVRVTDGNDSPTNVSLLGISISENQPAGTVVGSFVTTDQDAGDSFTYALVDGDGSEDNALFAVAANTLATATGLDYESKTVYSIRVRATDQGGLYTEKALTIWGIDANDAPSDIVLSCSAVAENQPSGTTVGTLGAVDQDAGDTFTYALVAGEGDADNGSFSVIGGALRTNASFNFETKNSYSIRVRATDQGGLYVEKAIAIGVTDVNEPPMDVSLSNTSIPENRAAGLVVGTLLATDPDGGETFAFALVDGDGSEGNAFFAIDGDRLVTASAFDCESQNTYGVRIRATDQGGLYIERALSIGVTDSNIALSNDVLPENEPAGTEVGSLSTLELSGQTYSYSLVGGAGSADNARFVIDGDGLTTACPLDYESASIYCVRVRATNQLGLYAEQAMTVRLTDLNEPPTELLLSKTTVAENRPVGTEAGVFSGVDPDLGDNLTYSLVDGDGSEGNESFVLDGASLRAAASFDHETQDSYSIRVRATDQGGLVFERVFAISVTDVNETPADMALSNSTVAENLAAGTLVGSLSTTDPDAFGTFSYTLVGGDGSTDNGLFAISGDELRTAAAFDHETQSSLSIRIRATDQGGLYVEKVFAVTVTNVNERPTDVALSSTSIAENEPSRSVVGCVTTTDPDAGDTFAYALVDGAGSADNGQFVIVGDSLQTAASFNHEEEGTLSVRVRATDQAGLYIEKVFAITVTDVNEQPTEVTLSGKSILENQPAGTVVGAFATTDPDAGDTFVYALVDGNGSEGNTMFAIDGGVLASVAEFDYDVAAAVSIRVRSTDQGGLYVENTFAITVLDDATAPTVTGVVVGGTGWAGSPADGFPIPTGSGEQLLPLPWMGIDRLSVVFSEDVLIEQNDLALYGVNTTQYDIGAGTFVYDSATFTATWTLAEPLGAERLTICLNADGESPIQDAAGNRLDGEWTNPADVTDPAADTFPSGDSTPGGDLIFRFNVLPGDADRSGTVDAADRTAIFPQIGHLASADVPLDIDGNGVIAYADMYAVHQRLGHELPAASVSPAIAAMDAAVSPLSLAMAETPTAVTAQPLAAAAETPAADNNGAVAAAASTLDEALTAIAAATIAPIPTTIPADPLSTARRAAAHDAVLAAAARQDTETPAESLARWDWLWWYDLERLRQHKRASNRERLADAPHRDLRHATLR